MSNYYHVNKATLEIISGPHAPLSTYVKKLTSCGNPDLLDLSSYDLVPEVREPLADGQKHGEPVVTAEAVTIPAIAKSAEELAADKQSRIAQMETACREYVELKGDLTGTKGRIHFTAAPMVDRKAAAGKVKNKACSDWVTSVWMLYYTRLAALEAGGAWDDAYLDFSSCGQMPYSIQECLAEV